MRNWSPRRYRSSKGNEVAPLDVKEVRIELPVDAHLPDDYVPEQGLRLEAYRRLATATAPAEVDDVEAEWADRFGPLPPAATALIDIARLRVEALRVGITEMVNLRSEVRLAPVDLSQSQEIRLQRLAPEGDPAAPGRGLVHPGPGRSGGRACSASSGICGRSSYDFQLRDLKGYRFAYNPI